MSERNHMEEYNRACGTGLALVYGIVALSGAIAASAFWIVAWILIK